MSEFIPTSGEKDGADEPPSDDMLAGEYVLGVLDVEQCHAVEVRINVEPTFARQIAEWEHQLGSMAASIEPADVPDNLWPQLCNRLGWPSVSRGQGGFWRSLGFWRAAAAVAATVAIAAIIVGVPRLLAPQSNQAVVQPVSAPVTTIAHDNGTPAWLASIDARRGTLLLVPVPSPADRRERVPELWLIPPGEAPRPLGLLSNERTFTVIVPADLRTALTTRGAALAVSLEPPGGAPHGAPTGPIVAKGIIQL